MDTAGWTVDNSGQDNAHAEPNSVACNPACSCSPSVGGAYRYLNPVTAQFSHADGSLQQVLVPRSRSASNSTTRCSRTSRPLDDLHLTPSAFDIPLTRPCPAQSSSVTSDNTSTDSSSTSKIAIKLEDLINQPVTTRGGGWPGARCGTRHVAVVPFFSSRSMDATAG